MGYYVCEDDVKRIHEFHAAGLGRKKIADYLDLNASAVVSVLRDEHETITEHLSVRQRGELIAKAFGPPRGR